MLVSSGWVGFAPFLLDQRLDADGKVGAGDAVLAVVERDVVGADLEFARRELLALLDDLLGAGRERRAVADQRARAERAGAEQLRRVDIVVAQLDPVLGKAEDVARPAPGTRFRAPAPTGRRWNTSRACRPSSTRSRPAPCPCRRTARGTAQARCRAACPSRFAALRRSRSRPSPPPPARCPAGAPDRRCRRSSRSASSAGTRPCAGDCAGAASTGSIPAAPPPPRPAAPRDRRRWDGRRRDRRSSASCW